MAIPELEKLREVRAAHQHAYEAATVAEREALDAVAAQLSYFKVGDRVTREITRGWDGEKRTQTLEITRVRGKWATGDAGAQGVILILLDCFCIKKDGSRSVRGDTMHGLSNDPERFCDVTLLSTTDNRSTA